MNIIVPKEITSSMIKSGTSIAEPSASETAWVSGGTYAVGDLRIRSTTHRKYYCVQASSGRSVFPEDDPTYWKDVGPTDRFAPFDAYSSTSVSSLTSITYVLEPGFFNALSFYNVVGETLSVTVKNQAGGSVIYNYSGNLYEYPTGWYNYLFGTRIPRQKTVLTNIPISPTAEVTITVTGNTGATVSIGMIVVGDYTPLTDVAGTQYGATAEPVTYSYISTDESGITTIKRRHSGTNLDVSVMMPIDVADVALATVQRVLDVPVAWIATDAANYQGLNVFGIGSGQLSYDSPGYATFKIRVKGMI